MGCLHPRGRGCLCPWGVSASKEGCLHPWGGSAFLLVINLATQKINLNLSLQYFVIPRELHCMVVMMVRNHVLRKTGIPLGHFGIPSTSILMLRSSMDHYIMIQKIKRLRHNGKRGNIPWAVNVEKCSTCGQIRFMCREHWQFHL